MPFPTKFDHVLVLMACSDTKLPHPEQPRRLYLGPMWQTLRTHIGAIPWHNVFVLSGKYGFIESQHFIQSYNERLTREKADALIATGTNPQDGGFHPNGDRRYIGWTVSNCVRPWQYRDHPPFTTVIVAGAGEYRRVFDAFLGEFREQGIVAGDATIVKVRGGIGEQRQQLGQWLQDLNAGRQITQPMELAA